MSKETYKLLQRKKRKGLDFFYERYAKRLFGYATSNWHSDEDTAWELIYQTLDSVIESIDRYTFESEEKFGAFVLTAFLNRLRNHHRNSKKNIETVSVEESSELSNLVDTEKYPDSAMMQNLKVQLQKLEDWERMLLLLRAQQMPYSEIARYVDKPEKQLKVYYQRLKNRLEKEIKEKKEAHNG